MVEFRKNASRDALYDLATKNGVAVAENADRDAIIKALTAYNMQEAAKGTADGAAGGAESGPEDGEGNDTAIGENAAERPVEGAQEDGGGTSENRVGGKPPLEDAEGAESGGEKTAQRPAESATSYDTFIYVGPSIPRGRLKENAVFRGTMADVLSYLADVVEEYPQIPRLIVPTNRLATFSAKVKTPGNIAHKYYTDIASAIRSKKGKGGVNGG